MPDDGSQVDNECPPLTKIAHFATVQMLHPEPNLIGGENARFGPQAQRKKLGTNLALCIHQPQCLRDRERATVLGG